MITVNLVFKGSMHKPTDSFWPYQRGRSGSCQTLPTAVDLSELFIDWKLNNSIPVNPLLVLLHTEFERLTFEVFRQPFKHMAPRLNIEPIPIVISKLPDKWEQGIAQGLTDDLSAIEKKQIGRALICINVLKKNLFVRNWTLNFTYIILIVKPAKREARSN